MVKPTTYHQPPNRNERVSIQNNIYKCKMFAKLIGKIKPVGRQDVGSLDMFLLSDSDEDDMANDTDFFGSLKKQHLKRKKIAEKYNKSNDKKTEDEKEDLFAFKLASFELDVVKNCKDKTKKAALRKAQTPLDVVKAISEIK